MRRDKLLKKTGLALAIAATLTGVAYGEENETETDGEKQAGINKIIITAQKRSESLQEVPLAVTAIYGDKLREDGVKVLLISADKPLGLFSHRLVWDNLKLLFVVLVQRKMGLQLLIQQLFLLMMSTCQHNGIHFK